MGCDPYRAALSARLDGEDPGLDPALLDRHLARCPGCRAFAAGAASLDGAVRGAARATPPELGPRVLLALGRETGERGARIDLRVPLALLAVLKLVVALPAFVGAGPADAAHLSREVGSFDVALAVGLLVVAWRPHRAAGLLPVLVALSACLAVTAAVDVASGAGSVGGEALHLADVVGTAFVWAVARAERPGRPAAPRRPVAA